MICVWVLGAVCRGVLATQVAGEGVLKLDESVAALVPAHGALDPDLIARVIGARVLAHEEVPAVRERMQRIRMLTAIAVGAIVTEGLDDNPRARDASPYLVWEWLVVEAMTRSMRDDPGLWGVPGTLVTASTLCRIRTI